MLSKPEIGMKVRITGISCLLETKPGDTDVRFHSDECNTGTLVDIQKRVLRAHQPKTYLVRFDPPNFGTFEFTGTEHLEKADNA
jgi:hypothetical protein